MEKLNYIEIETRSGFRSFELHCGDITKLPFNVDVLVISAFKNDYSPIPNTIIGSLYNSGVDAYIEFENRLYDFQDSLGIWLSREIKNKSFKYILCIEMVGSDFELEDIIKNLFTFFSILEYRRLQVRSIALPLMGTGNQGISLSEIIKPLLENSLEFLKHSRFLEKIVFINKNKEKALELNEAMDIVLKREKIKIPKGQLVEGIKQEILANIEKIKPITGDKDILYDLSRIISSKYTRPFELGGISRKIVEFIVEDISPSKKQFELWKKIDSLSSINIAQWIIGYMHVLRVFGNEAVHDRNKDNRNPEFIDEKDLELCLFCIQRILDFYYSFKK